MSGQLYVISDLHLESDQDPYFTQFLQSFSQILKAGDTLILLGDMLDLFTGGNRGLEERYRSWIRLFALQPFAQCQIFYVEGNHDINLDLTFSGLSNLTLIKSRLILEFSGKKIHFEHGDLVNQSDWSYLWLRQFLRTSFFRWASTGRLGMLAYGFGWLLSKLSRGSRYRTLVGPGEGTLVESQIPVVREIFHRHAKVLFQQGHSIVVMGHCHDLDELRTTEVNQSVNQYINVGFPKGHHSYLKFDQDTRFFIRQPIFN